MTAHGSGTPVSVSVAIVTYNRPEHVRDCLTHVAAQTLRPREVVVVDASPGSDTRGVVAQFADVIYVRNERGAGTTATSRALALDVITSDVIVFFDDDAYAEPHCVERLASHYDDPRVGGVGGRASNGVPGEEADGIDRIGRLLPDGTLSGFFSADPGRPVEVDHLLGANMSWRVAAVRGVGGIRDQYPGTCLREESDIALRVGAAGWRIRYDPAALVRHVAGPYASGRRFDVRYSYFAARNHVVLLATTLGWRSSHLRAFGRVAIRIVLAHYARALSAIGAVRRTGVRAAARGTAGGIAHGSAVAIGTAMGLAAAATSRGDRQT